jgi:hypothetical protein
MPSAEELQAMSDKDVAEEDFIRSANYLIESAARIGFTSGVVPVERNIEMTTAKKILEKNFPNCQITERWWSHCFKVSWKKRN